MGAENGSGEAERADLLVLERPRRCCGSGSGEFPHCQAEGDGCGSDLGRGQRHLGGLFLGESRGNGLAGGSATAQSHPQSLQNPLMSCKKSCFRRLRMFILTTSRLSLKAICPLPSRTRARSERRGRKDSPPLDSLSAVDRRPPTVASRRATARARASCCGPRPRRMPRRWRPKRPRCGTARWGPGGAVGVEWRPWRWRCGC